MSEGVIVRHYANDDPKLAINDREIYRYAGYLGFASEPDEQVSRLLEEVKQELQPLFTYQVCYRRMPVHREDDRAILPFSHQSNDVQRCLKDSEEMILFAATIGFEVDRRIMRYGRVSPTKALLMQAYGAERVEALCDAFCADIKEELACEGLYPTPRYSPGYGDLPLEVQKDVFRLLDVTHQIGVVLNPSLLMTPSKSVTALFGLRNCPSIVQEHQCSNCDAKDCTYREE